MSNQALQIAINVQPTSSLYCLSEQALQITIYVQAGSVTALTTGDMDLQLLKRRQAEGEEMAHKHRDQAEPEPDIISEGADITLQAGSFEAQFVPGNLLWK